VDYVMGEPKRVPGSVPAEALAFSQRQDPAVRARLAGPGLRTFFNIAVE